MKNVIHVFCDCSDCEDSIKKDKALEYVLENYYDEVREAVFEQEVESQRE